MVLLQMRVSFPGLGGTLDGEWAVECRSTASWLPTCDWHLHEKG